jgi:hypothetical protein
MHEELEKNATRAKIQNLIFAQIVPIRDLLKHEARYLILRLRLD